MPDFQIFILGLTILANLFLGGLVLAKNYRDKINLSFGCFVLSIILWTLAMLLFKIINNELISLFWLRFSYLAAGLIGVSFFVFVVSFTQEKINRFIWLLLSLTTTAMSLLIFQPWFLIRGVTVNQWDKSASISPGHYILFGFYFGFFFFGSLLMLWHNYKKVTGMEKIRLMYILWGTLLGGVLGTFFNLVLPSFLFNEWRFTWLGPIFTLIFVLFIALDIIKYKLMRIRVIAVELFTIAILIISGNQIFFSNNITELILNITIFVFLSIFGVVLIKNEWSEVRRQEQIQQLAENLKKTADKLQAANTRLKELDQLKSDFISIASHQLRTPLTTIKGLLSLVLEGFWVKDKTREKQELEKVYVSNQRLINLVETLLNISRIESGRMVYNFELSSLEEIVKSVVDELMILARAKKLELCFEKSDGPFPQIKIDALAIRQVVMNFIDNAIIYTKEGKIAVKLSRLQRRDSAMAGEKRDEKIIFSVTDTGIGFSPSQRKLFFEKFSRADSGPKGGFGLGLYAAANIIEAHHGEIGADSPGEEKGSTFWFSLPTGQAGLPTGR